MKIDILDLKRICQKYNKDPLNLRIVFDYYCVKLDANFLCDRIWRRYKAISYQLFETLSIAQFESLVDDFMDEFISEVKRKDVLACDRISDEVRADPLPYEPDLVSFDIPKTRWIHFGDFPYGKGFYCSNCGYRVHMLDGAYPSEKKCPNCEREMGFVRYKEVHDTQ